jgi:phosphoribosylformylglycinamidine cyclo-ligase
MAHITGGGLIDNLPRVLPKGTAVEIELGSWPIPPLFQLLTQRTSVDAEECYQVFNMGIGMTAVVSPADAATILKQTRAHIIGRVVKGGGDVRLV